MKDKRISKIFDSYPPQAGKMAEKVRNLIHETAARDGHGDVQELLKWGEPSFVTREGSPVRVAWKEDTPEVLGVFFSCGSKLVSTFRVVFGDALAFSGNRAILLNIKERLPTEALICCISAALAYHRRKNLEMLGM